MKLKVKTLEGDFFEIIESIIANNIPILVQGTDEYQVWEEPTFAHIPVLNINIHSATTYVYDEDTDDFEISGSQYNFYDHTTGEFKYSECGSSLSVCIYNYCYFAGLTEWHDLDKIENLGCVYVLAPKALKKNGK